jgi:hypothetical protein
MLQYTDHSGNLYIQIQFYYQSNYKVGKNIVKITWIGCGIFKYGYDGSR